MAASEIRVKDGDPLTKAEQERETPGAVDYSPAVVLSPTSGQGPCKVLVPRPCLDGPWCSARVYLDSGVSHLVSPLVLPARGRGILAS